MSIEKDLKKDGITVIKPVDTLNVTLIAKYVADKLISTFPFYGLNYNKLFIRINNIPMYIADIPDTMGDASYFYKNSAMYFKDGLSILEMKKCAIHEFIHAHQEIKDKNNVLYRLGLCDFTGFKIKGMALNEGAVQFLAAKALKEDEELVKYYDIEFNANTPNYYPIICNLVGQMAYITGEDVLFDSTFNSNSKFIKSFINLCGEKTFKKVQNNLDKILDLEQKLSFISSSLQQDDLSIKFITNYSLKIGAYKREITKTFIETQESILTSYFNRAINNVYSAQDIEDFRSKLYNYRDLLGVTENYSFFNDYYIDMMTKLDDKYEALNNIELSLVAYKRSLSQIIIEKIRALLGLSKEYEFNNN